MTLKVVLTALGLAALLLTLNVLEPDRYLHGLEAPTEADQTVDPPPWMPAVLAHPCADCGPCLHELRLDECRIDARILDEDGWYRLFWAGDETYHYADPAYFSGELKNGSARAAGGEWVIAGRYEPMFDCGPHACPSAPAPFRLTFRLRLSDLDPDAHVPLLDASGSFAVPTAFLWARRRVHSDTTESIQDLWWELVDPAAFRSTAGVRCATRP